MFDKAENVARSLPADAWQCLSAGDGTKGPRRHDWAYVELAHLGADEYVEGAEELWTRGLLIRRHRTDSELAYFSTSCRHLDRSSCRGRGHRWSIEDAFETAKDELGLDHNETRSWHGWHRHVSLVMLAFAILAVTRHHANAIAEQTLPRLSRAGTNSSAGRSRKSDALPPALHKVAFSRGPTSRIFLMDPVSDTEFTGAHYTS